MAVYFIADQHFGIYGETPDKFRKFSQFIEHIKSTDILFIVGDLFDFYFEHKKHRPKRYPNILNKLNELKKKGTKIHYIVGNHDFWVGDSFTKELGIKVYKKPIQLTLQDKNVFIAHGDDINGNDPIKQLLRNKLAIELFSYLSPGIAQVIGSLVSRISGKFSGKKMIRWKLLYDLGKGKFSEGTDIVVLAHIHSPKFLDYNGKKFVILGDWIKHFTYGKLENGKFKLCSWRE